MDIAAKLLGKKKKPAGFFRKLFGIFSMSEK
jgi:hypothetical protein